MFIWTFLITKTYEITSCSYALKSWNTLHIDYSCYVCNCLYAGGGGGENFRMFRQCLWQYLIHYNPISPSAVYFLIYNYCYYYTRCLGSRRQLLTLRLARMGAVASDVAASGGRLQRTVKLIFKFKASILWPQRILNYRAENIQYIIVFFPPKFTVSLRGGHYC